MYGKEESKQLRQRFWTAFGHYMRKYRSQRGPKQKWLNYRTGVKDIFFRLDANKRKAWVAIELQHRDPDIRALFYEQFEQLQMLIESTSGEEWIWQPRYFLDNGKEIARIFVEQEGFNIYNQDQWGALFEWFAPRIVALDEVWADAMHIFEDLTD